MPSQVADLTAPRNTTTSQGRISHAYPANSLIALCGVTRTENAPQGHGTQCPRCVNAATQRNWAAR